MMILNVLYYDSEMINAMEMQCNCYIYHHIL